LVLLARKVVQDLKNFHQHFEKSVKFHGNSNTLTYLS
jgi:hypothetical protein